MRKIVINTALKKMNKRAFTHEKSTDVFEEIPFSPSAYEHLEAEDIMKLIATLPEGYRQVFSLHAIEGYSHKEIGQLLNIQEVTSRSHLFKAKKQLKSMLNDLNQEELWARIG